MTTHFHIETDHMSTLGTFTEQAEAEQHAERFTINGRAAGYTTHQMAGGARAAACECWMGAYVLRQRAT